MSVPIAVAVLFAVVLLTVIILVSRLVYQSRKMESGAAYIATDKDYEMSPTTMSPDIEKPKFSNDVSFEPI